MSSCTTTWFRKRFLTLASPLAEIVNVGKRCGVKSITQEEINALMIEQRPQPDR